MIDTERKAGTQAEEEGSNPSREPDVGLNPGTPGSHPELQAGAKPLSHPGIPNLQLSKSMSALRQL